MLRELLNVKNASTEMNMIFLPICRKKFYTVQSFVLSYINSIFAVMLRRIYAMSKFNPHKPIPYALSMWAPGTEVFYKCSACGQTFKMFYNQEHFCHNCGLEQDWSDSPRYCSESFKNEYDELVYNQHAHTNGEREQDNALVKLLSDFYFAIKR
jgi:hypothetical protein